MPKGTRRLLISDDSENSFKFVLETKGADLSHFKRNPVLILAHDITKMPIGRLEDIKIEGDKITGVPDFDDDDEVAMKAYKKYEKGYLNAASVGFNPTEISTEDDGKGQKTLKAVTKWTLQEVSLVSVPSNPNALQLSYDVKEASVQAATQLAADNIVKPQEPKNPKDMKGIAMKLGLHENATEQEITLAIDGLQTQLSARQVDALVMDAKAKGHFAEQGSEMAFRTLAASSLSNAKAFVDSLPELKSAAADAKTATEPAPVVATTLMANLAKAQDATAAVQNATVDKANWTYLQWSKEDPKGLLEIKRNDPSRYSRLAADYKP
jgi:HK97 family phage prohead protease